MSYPGDSALAADVQQRILTTFQQTLDLASKGNRQEALLGCDFILRLDPQFGPARTLQQLVNAGRSGPQLAELLGPQAKPSSPAPGAGAPPAATTSEFESLGDLALDLPDDLPLTLPPAGGDLPTRLKDLFARREFAELLALADREKRALAGDATARQLVEQTHSKLEAEPYVKTFLESARQAIQTGDKDEAERLLRKARSLDADHPEIARLEEARQFYDDPSRSMGARRRGIQMEDPLEGGAPLDGPGRHEPSLELPEVDFRFGDAGDDELSFGGEGVGALDERAGGGENAGRIRELLAEGQGAFERGEFQAAIDAWSRIFLIDIDHHEAARRIEQARQLKAEREREVEELFHGGVGQFDVADFDGAERSFRRVLELAPGYVLAEEYLERIDERRAGAPSASAAATLGSPRAGVEPGAGEGARGGGRGGRDRVGGEILVPPEPGSSRSRGTDDRPAFAVAAKRRSGPSVSFLFIGGAVLALLLAGGWLLVKNRARLFPNAKEPLDSPAPAMADPMARAKALHADGKTAIAIAQLRRLPPQDAHYAEAQSLIVQWEALVKPADPVPAGPPPELRVKRAGLLESAEKACREEEFLRCRRLLDQAAALAPLEPSLLSLSENANQGLLPLAEELRIYADEDFDHLLNRLWRRRESEPNNRDVKQLIVDSYYNLGVLELQRGDPAAAADRFREARKLEPADPELDRIESFALTYTHRPDDLLFQIFVRNLSNR